MAKYKYITISAVERVTMEFLIKYLKLDSKKTSSFIVVLENLLERSKHSEIIDKLNKLEN